MNDLDKKDKVTMYNCPQEWLKKPLVIRLEELRKANCTGPCGQSMSIMNKRTSENQTLTEAIELITQLLTIWRITNENK